MGVISTRARTGDQLDTCTSDGSNLEFSWAIPHGTDPSDESNRGVCFAVGPFHPERGHRIAGGAVLDHLWSDEGNMGLIKKEDGSKDWKDIVEKWLYSDIEHSGEFVEGTTYVIAILYGTFTSTTSHQAKNCITAYHGTDDLEPFKHLVRELRPSLEAPFKMVVNFFRGVGKESGVMWIMMSCKIYFFMDHFTKDNYETAKATELVFQDVGKPAEKAGW
ncbi:hypothetical protein DXG01_009191 [Tephrocybe rancida]|nr:hypothetical protein DXG01_009191 [Tephrocybe rancida]